MITALLVDDEKKNRDSLKKLLAEYCPAVEVVGEAASVNEALSFLNRQRPQLIFLDVEMPNGSGFDFLRQVDKVDFKIIFVTAHSHYAIKAIRFSAVDYLLKPVDTDDLIEAVKKASEENHINREDHYKGLLNNLNNADTYKLAIPIKDGFVFLNDFEALSDTAKQKCKIVVLSSSISPEDINKASTNPYVIKYVNKPLSEKYLEAIKL